jgi:serine protease
MMKILCWTCCFLIQATLIGGAYAQKSEAPSRKALKEKALPLKALPLVRGAPDGVSLLGQAARSFAPSAADSAAPNDPYFKFQWYFKPLPGGMNAVGAWQKTTGSAEVVVAVLSTGILPKHPDIAGSGNLLAGYSFVTLNGEKPKADATDPGQDCSEQMKAAYEGTHLAGMVGAVKTNNGVAVAGLNWKVSVLPIRIVAKCQISPLDLVRAIQWAAGIKVEGFPVNPKPAHIIMINFAAQVECSRDNFGAVIDAIAAARSKGAVVVTPAGNGAADVKGFLPGGCPGVISVAASDVKGQFASYSNFGAVTLLAPGGDPEQKDENGVPGFILSVGRPDAKNQQGLAVMYGTDPAAAQVSGALALALAAHPDWRGKPDLIEQKLRACAAPVAACPQGCGAGQLDAARLVDGEAACMQKVAEAPSAIVDEPKVAEPRNVTPPSTVIEEPKSIDPAIVTAPPAKAAAPAAPISSAAPAPEASANPLAGQWFLPDGEGILVIGPKGDWTHPRHGAGRIREATDQADIAVFYANGGAQCSYRVSLPEGGKTLMLFAADMTQDASYCPSGELKSANR